MRAEDLPIPAPCSQDWSSMSGDDQRRFCEACQHSVTHLSKLTERDALGHLLENPDGCVRVDSIGDTILFEPEPIHSSTFRTRGRLRRAAMLGAGLALGAPAFASSQTEAPTALIHRAANWLASFVSTPQHEEEPGTSIVEDPAPTMNLGESAVEIPLPKRRMGRPHLTVKQREQAKKRWESLQKRQTATQK